ncbi:MAG: type II/IV secretion system ATPase subunit, partial [Thermoplasmatales archaeon]|nr:type II/IV secretion system ATPase subunit [Thermoplasmatales archaeon]
MIKKIAICPKCKSKISCTGEKGDIIEVKCNNCGNNGKIFLGNLNEIDFYPVKEPFAFIKILKNPETLDQHYRVIEPILTEPEEKILRFIKETLIKLINVRLDEVESDSVEGLLIKHIDQALLDYEIKADSIFKKKLLYYVKREFLGYGPIDPVMRDPNIEDISCDGSGVPLFLFHRKHGSLKSNVQFDNENELSDFVVKLAQKCGKHISIAEPMLDATMPDGSRLQTTLSTEVTTKGSTFTIRKFKKHPFSPPDLIEFNTMSAEMVAYLWLAVENGINALVAGGTAAGKTSTLNALCLFIPREAKIVS